MIPIRKRPPIFKTFFSSTFNDFQEERDVLQARVFPRLQELCGQRGAVFQAVDLRWGITDEASRDQQTLDICLREIRDCKRISPRPSFVCFLGDRYGWRPLPTGMDAETFERLLPSALLSAWYLRDENAVPPQYLLQKRQGEFLRDEVWSATEAELRAELARASSPLPGEIREEFFLSATEHEIREGLRADREDLLRTYCFVRELDNMPADCREGFTDTVPDGRGGALPDAGARADLLRLKALVRASLPPENTRTFTVSFQDRQSILEDFAESVYRRLSETILCELERLGTVDVFEEAMAIERAFGSKVSAHYTGFEAELRRAQQWIRQGDGLVTVVGQTGKSAFCAKLASLYPGAVVRHIGASGYSAAAEPLFAGIARELGLPVAESAPLGVLLQAVRAHLLAHGTVLILDGLDKLKEIPLMLYHLSDIHTVVVSVTDERLLEAYQLEACVRTGNLEGRDALRFFTALVAGQSRRLTEAQQRFFQERVLENPAPAYVRLAAANAAALPSFATPRFAGELDGVFREMVESLTRAHSEKLVIHTLCYLALSRYGLGYTTLFGMLRTDAVLFADFSSGTHHRLPKPELPISVFSRLAYDLAPQLETVSRMGLTLMRFAESAFAAYVLAHHLRPDILAHAISYFAAQPNLAAGEANVEKISELPHLLLRAGDAQGYLRLVVQRDFLHAKFLAGLDDELVAELEAGIAQGEALLPPLSRAIARTRRALQRHPALAGNLLHFTVGKEAAEGSADAARLAALLPAPGFAYQGHTAYRGLQPAYRLRREQDITTFAKFSPAGDRLLLGTAGGKPAIWDIRSGFLEDGPPPPVTETGGDARSQMFFSWCVTDEDTVYCANGTEVWRLRAPRMFREGFRYMSWKRVYRSEVPMSVMNIATDVHIARYYTRGGRELVDLAVLDTDFRLKAVHDLDFVTDPSSVNEIAYSPTGSLAMAFANGQVICTDGLVYNGYQGALGCTFFDGGKRIAACTSTGELKILTADDNIEQVIDCRVPGLRETACESVVYAATLNSFLISCRNGYLAVVNAATHKVFHVYTGMPEGILPLCLSPDEAWLAVAGRKHGHVHVYQTRQLAPEQAPLARQIFGEMAVKASVTREGYVFESHFHRLETNQRKLFYFREGRPDALGQPYQPLSSCQCYAYDALRDEIVYALGDGLFFGPPGGPAQTIHHSGRMFASLAFSEAYDSLAALDTARVLVFRREGEDWRLRREIPLPMDHPFDIPMLLTEDWVMVSAEQQLVYPEQAFGRFSLRPEDAANRLAVFSLGDGAGERYDIPYAGFLTGLWQTGDGLCYALGAKQVLFEKDGKFIGGLTTEAKESGVYRCGLRGEHPRRLLAGGVCCAHHCRERGLLFAGQPGGEIACIDLARERVVDSLKIDTKPISLHFDPESNLLRVADDGAESEGIALLYNFRMQSADTGAAQ